MSGCRSYRRVDPRLWQGSQRPRYGSHACKSLSKSARLDSSPACTAECGTAPMLSGISRPGLHSSECIVILPDMVTGHMGRTPFSHQQNLGLLIPSEARFILEHQADFFSVVDNFQLFNLGPNFLRPRSSHHRPFWGVCFRHDFAPPVSVQHKVYLAVTDWMVDLGLICRLDLLDLNDLSLFCSFSEGRKNHCFFFHTHVAVVSTIMIA